MASAHSPAGQFSQADLNRIVSRAVAAERVRVAQVFSNHASRGRERISAALLTDPRGLGAEDIIVKLAAGPTDREADASRAARNHHTNAS